MKKTCVKYLPVVLFTVMAAAIAIACVILFKPVADVPDLLSVVVPGEPAQTVRLWQGEDNTYYAFLPSHARLDSSSFESEVGFSLDGIACRGGQSLSDIELGHRYSLCVDGAPAEECSLIFMKSGNVASLYITASDKMMASVLTDKSYSGRVNITILDPDGRVDYLGLSDTVKGHGASSWKSCEKKSLSLTLSSPASLLGMNPSDKWLLVANGFDETNMRNKLSLDLAREIMPQWSPDSEFADVYINGEYYGLYLLCEKIGVAEGKVEHPGGDFAMLEITNVSRSENGKQYISLDDEGKRLFEVNYPSDLTANQLNTLTDASRRLNRAIVDGEDASLALLDWDSWALKIAFDEALICADTDAFSVFYLYDAQTDTFSVGPMWDYDLSLGNTGGASTGSSRIPTQLMCNRLPWYGRLYKNPLFYARVIDTYRDIILPGFINMAENTVPELSARLRCASEMNSIRWSDMFSLVYLGMNGLDSALEVLTDFIAARLEYLDKVWIRGEEEITVFFVDDEGVSVGVASVLPGEILSQDTPDAFLGIEYSHYWIDKATGEPFDFSKPITDTHILKAVITDEGYYYAEDLKYRTEEPEGFIGGHWDEIKIVMLISVTAIILIFLIRKDKCYSSDKGGHTDNE